MFENWYEKIINNKENFIEYYVSQFGEEKRKLISERFDSIKYCFYVDPSYIEIWVALQLEVDYGIATYDFLKEFGSQFDIDISKLLLNFSKDFGYVSVNSKDDNIRDKIRNLFTGSAIALRGLPEEDQFSELYSFRKLEDFIDGEGRYYRNPEEELLQRRLLFLIYMGDISIEGIPIDYYKSEECKNFVASSKYKELMAKYCALVEKALEYKRKVDLKYKDILEFMNESMKAEQQIIEKYNILKDNEQDPAKIEEYEKACRKEIALARIVGGNFNLHNCLDEDAALDCIIDSGDAQITQHCCVDENQELIIFFCPFKSVPGYEDVDLRHEIRHAITSSVSIEDGVVTYKIGNKIEKYVGEDCIDCQCLEWNEWVTQFEAKRETLDAFSRQIYIVSKPSIKNQNFIGQTSDYDPYLPSFEIIYNSLPLLAKQSQMELTNAAFYAVLSLEQLSDIQKMIINGRYDDKLMDKLNSIVNQLIRNNGLDNDVVKR